MCWKQVQKKIKTLTKVIQKFILVEITNLDTENCSKYRKLENSKNYQSESVNGVELSKFSYFYQLVQVM